jgi:hypothetical protein
MILIIYHTPQRLSRQRRTDLMTTLKNPWEDLKKEYPDTNPTNGITYYMKNYVCVVCG